MKWFLRIVDLYSGKSLLIIGHLCLLLLRTAIAQVASSGASTVCFRALESFTGGGAIDTTSASNSDEYRYLLSVASLAASTATPAECTFDLFVPGTCPIYSIYTVYIRI